MAESKDKLERLEAAISDAAKNLPEGYLIQIEIERNSTSVQLWDMDEVDELGFPSNHESLTETVGDAVEFACKDAKKT